MSLIRTMGGIGAVAAPPPGGNVYEDRVPLDTYIDPLRGRTSVPFAGGQSFVWASSQPEVNAFYISYDATYIAINSSVGSGGGDDGGTWLYPPDMSAADHFVEWKYIRDPGSVSACGPSLRVTPGAGGTSFYIDTLSSNLRIMYQTAPDNGLLLSTTTVSTANPDGVVFRAEAVGTELRLSRDGGQPEVFDISAYPAINGTLAGLYARATRTATIQDVRFGEL